MSARLTEGVVKTSRRWTVGRMFGVGAAVLFLGFGGSVLWGGYSWFRDLERWREERPMEGVIDLSGPGEFVFAVNQTCSVCCQESVMVRVPPEVLQNRTAEEVLTGLIARLEIVGENGESVATSESRGFVALGGNFGDAIPLFHFRPLRRGTYKATITVVSGAAALKGVTQRAEGRYLLCGVEKMTGYAGVGVGAVCLVIGCVIGGMVWAGAVKGRGKMEKAVGNGVVS